MPAERVARDLEAEPTLVARGSLPLMNSRRGLIQARGTESEQFRTAMGSTLMTTIGASP